MVNKIVLGTVQFGLNYGINNSTGRPGQSAVKSILDLAFEKGISLLDTAEAYGNAQEVIGDYHRDSASQFDVITKFSAKRTDLSASLAERVLQDLQTLHVKFLYGYMFHSFSDFEKYYPQYKIELEQLKKKNLVKKTGVSIYTSAELEKLLDYEGIDLVQLPFNLLDNNYQRYAALIKAKSKGIEIHTRSVFLQGLFFKDSTQLPEKLKVLKPHLDKITRLASTYHLSLNDLALNYAVHQKHIDRVLIGVDSRAQLEQNIDSLNNKIPEELMVKIDGLRVDETGLLNPANWS